MKVIARPMGTGKTKELLEYAASHNGQVLTTDKNALEVKAKSYGIKVPIIDLYDFTYNNDYNPNKQLFIHKIEDVLSACIERPIDGYSIRMEK